jgi:hypothetical protein
MVGEAGAGMSMKCREIDISPGRVDRIDTSRGASSRENDAGDVPDGSIGSTCCVDMSIFCEYFDTFGVYVDRIDNTVTASRFGDRARFAATAGPGENV